MLSLPGGGELLVGSFVSWMFGALEFASLNCRVDWQFDSPCLFVCRQVNWLIDLVVGSYYFSDWFR